MKNEQVYEFLENNPTYTVVLSILALVSGVESVFEFSLGKTFVPHWVDTLIFSIFCIDLVLKIAVYVGEKVHNPKVAFSGLFSLPFTVVDLVALVPDVVSHIVGSHFIDLKALRALRALKLLRLSRVFSKNKSLFDYILNFFRYRLYGQGLVLGINSYCFKFKWR